MAEEQGTIEKVLHRKPFKVFDSHGHPGLEKKGITERPGCLDFWCGRSVVARSMMGARACLGDPNPLSVITRPEECPELTPASRNMPNHVRSGGTLPGAPGPVEPKP